MTTSPAVPTDVSSSDAEHSFELIDDIVGERDEPLAETRDEIAPEPVMSQPVDAVTAAQTQAEQPTDNEIAQEAETSTQVPVKEASSHKEEKKRRGWGKMHHLGFGLALLSAIVGAACCAVTLRNLDWSRYSEDARNEPSRVPTNSANQSRANAPDVQLLKYEDLVMEKDFSIIYDEPDRRIFKEVGNMKLRTIEEVFKAIVRMSPPVHQKILANFYERNRKINRLGREAAEFAIESTAEAAGTYTDFLAGKDTIVERGAKMVYLYKDLSKEAKAEFAMQFPKTAAAFQKAVEKLVAQK